MVLSIWVKGDLWHWIHLPIAIFASFLLAPGTPSANTWAPYCACFGWALPQSDGSHLKYEIVTRFSFDKFSRPWRNSQLQVKTNYTLPQSEWVCLCWRTEVTRYNNPCYPCPGSQRFSIRCARFMWERKSYIDRILLMRHMRTA